MVPQHPIPLVREGEQERRDARPVRSTVLESRLVYVDAHHLAEVDRVHREFHRLDQPALGSQPAGLDHRRVFELAGERLEDLALVRPLAGIESAPVRALPEIRPGEVDTERTVGRYSRGGVVGRTQAAGDHDRLEIYDADKKPRPEVWGLVSPGARHL